MVTKCLLMLLIAIIPEPEQFSKVQALPATSTEYHVRPGAYRRPSATHYYPNIIQLSRHPIISNIHYYYLTHTKSRFCHPTRRLTPRKHGGSKEQRKMMKACHFFALISEMRRTSLMQVFKIQSRPSASSTPETVPLPKLTPRTLQG